VLNLLSYYFSKLLFKSIDYDYEHEQEHDLTADFRIKHHYLKKLAPGAGMRKRLLFIIIKNKERATTTTV